MAKVKITGHASGTGILTVTAPNTSTDRTITLPDADVTLGAATPSITDGGNATAMTIDSAENIGIGVVPETWHSGYTNLQVGALSEMCHKTTPTVHRMGNAYHDGSNYKHIITGISTQYSMEDGDHNFRTVASGSADATITWTEQLNIKADGRGLSQFTAKTWIDFNGDDTVAIRDSHNVAGLGDEGTGYYTVSHDVNLATVNGAAVCSASDSANTFGKSASTAQQATASFTVMGFLSSSGAAADHERFYAIVFGD